MASSFDCVCCCERPQIEDKIMTLANPVQCITDHPGLEAVCLNNYVWILQTAYFQFRQEYGTNITPLTINK